MLSSKGVSGTQAASKLGPHKLRASRLFLHHPIGIEGGAGGRERHIRYLTTCIWKTHITFIYNPLARTSHMAPPRCKRDGSCMFPGPKENKEMIW